MVEEAKRRRDRDIGKQADASRTLGALLDARYVGNRQRTDDTQEPCVHAIVPHWSCQRRARSVSRLVGKLQRRVSPDPIDLCEILASVLKTEPDFAAPTRG
jgi:hypothetical protein